MAVVYRSGAVSIAVIFLIFFVGKLLVPQGSVVWSAAFQFYLMKKKSTASQYINAHHTTFKCIFLPVQK